MHELLPKFDCGQCANPKCMTFARKVLLKIQQPEECIFATEDELQKIVERLGADVERRGPPQMPSNDEIVEIHPCTEEGMVTLWAQLKPSCGKNGLFGDFFDQYQLCDSIAQMDLFDKNECSPKMGYAYVELGGKRTHIFKTGKIILRRADDKEDAMAMLSMISNILLPARVCSCGNLMADCFGGCCDDCFESSCKAFLDGQEDKEGGETTLGEILQQNSGEIDEELKANFSRLSELMAEIKKIADGIESGQAADIEEARNGMAKHETAVSSTCTRKFLGDSRPEEVVIALVQFGLARDMIRAGEGFLSLGEGKEGFYEQAAGLFFDAYSAFEKRNFAACEALWPRYKSFISEWKEGKRVMGAAKIAANGFYISRILGKTVHDMSMFHVGRDDI
ncbi:MAG: hypothetical protein JSW28_01295 [Thermoplasmata archaeon]|nr:MAG: hypothetical protein JSW28_01295 [Thermoplasmata archaeon]